MADIVITKQELIDAQKDAQTLEDVISGEPGKLITTRLGRQVYTLASVPHINVMSREEVTSALAPKADKAEIAAALDTKANQADTFLKTEVAGLVAPKADKTYVDTALTGFTNGASKWYATLALAEADIANITIKDKVDIGEIANGGTWYKATAGATTLTKSPFDPLTQSKADATTKANNAETNAKIYADKKTAHLAELTLSKTETNSTVIPILVDSSNKTLIGYDTEKDQIQAGGLQEQVLDNLPNLMKSVDSTKIAVLTDAQNKILIGYDTANDKAIIAGIELPNQKPLIKAASGAFPE